MDELKILHTTEPLRKPGPGSYAAFAPGAQAHPGRMKLSLAVQALQWVDETSEVLSHIMPRPSILDPMAGVGTTGLAVNELGPQRLRALGALHGQVYFWGIEMVARWYEVLFETALRHDVTFQHDATLWRLGKGDATGAYSEIRWEVPSAFPALASLDRPSGPRPGSVDCIFTSPPFPNAHSQGNSELQRRFRDEKATYAGNDHDEVQADWRGENGYRASLALVMHRAWETLRPGGLAMVHTKDYVEGGERQRVDLWTADVLRRLPGAQVLGVLVAPLAYRSQFQEIQRFPLQTILDVQAVAEDPTDGQCIQATARLECGHAVSKGGERPTAKHKRTVARLLDGKQTRARCRQCPPRDVPQVTEERIVVVRRNEAHGPQPP